MSAPLPVRLLPRLAERAWFTPPRPSAEKIEGDGARLSRAEPIEVMVDGRSRPGYTIGAGPLVILAHGWGGRAAQMADLATAVAAAGFLAVAIDSPGHGSDSQSTSDGFQIAAGLRAIADRFGAPDAVVAHSLGAMASVMALHHAPPRSAVFLAPVLDLEEALARFDVMAGLAPWTASSLRRRVRGFVGERWPELTAAAEADLPGTEILIFHDPADPEVPIAASSELARRRPATRLVETPGTGHRRLLRQPELIEAVTGFLVETSKAVREAG